MFKVIVKSRQTTFTSRKQTLTGQPVQLNKMKSSLQSKNMPPLCQRSFTLTAAYLGFLRSFCFSDFIHSNRMSCVWQYTHSVTSQTRRSDRNCTPRDQNTHQTGNLQNKCKGRKRCPANFTGWRRLNNYEAFFFFFN